MKDIDLLFGVATNIMGKTLCAFGDAAATPVLTTLKLLPPRVRGARQGRPLHAAVAVARAQPAAAHHWEPTGAAWTSICLSVPHRLSRSCRPAVIGLLIFIVFNALIIASAILVLRRAQDHGLHAAALRPLSWSGRTACMQPFADILKLLFKEELRPKGADKWLFTLAPIAGGRWPAFTAFATVPFGADDDAVRPARRADQAGIADVNVGVLVVFAVTSMGVYGIVLAGWASNSKYSLFGGLRASAQMISYELSYATALAAVILLSGSLSLREIVDAQGGGFLGMSNWYIFLQPLGFIIYVIAGVAETNRAPFDFPEAEQELVAGFNTEYSSVRFALFPQAEYINMVTMSGRGHRPLPGRLARAVPAGGTRLGLVPREGRLHPLRLHLDALDACRVTATTS